MKTQSIDRGKRCILLISLAVWIAMFIGCASNRATDVAPETKQITDIVISEDSESLFLIIKASELLTYTVDRQIDPKGVLFQFQDTALDIEKGVYSPPEDDIIAYIKAEEVFAAKTPTSRIFIALNREAPYDVNPEGNGIKISLPKTAPPALTVKPQKPIVKLVPKETSTEKKIVPATRLKTVTATPLADKVTVRVEADGAIKEYTSFTMKNPARIVLDLPELKSPFKNEEKIAVDSRWLTRIRHFGHPDKVRLVLETRNDFLSKFSTHPTDNGLLINIGNVTATPAATEQAGYGVKPRLRQVELTWEDVPKATSYNLYLGEAPGVTRDRGRKIANVKKPYTLTDLKPGATYYFVVTAVNQSGESDASEELSFTVDE